MVSMSGLALVKLSLSQRAQASYYFDRFGCKPLFLLDNNEAVIFHGGLWWSVFHLKLVINIRRLSHANFFQSNIRYIVPKLIREAPIQPLILRSKLLIFLQRSDISLNSQSWPLVVVNVIQILVQTPTLVWERALWEALGGCGAISLGALAVRTGLRKVCIFR